MKSPDMLTRVMGSEQNDIIFTVFLDSENVFLEFNVQLFCFASLQSVWSPQSEWVWSLSIWEFQNSLNQK